MKAHLGCVDQLIGEALGDGLDVPESSFSCSRAQQPDSLRDISVLVEVNNQNGMSVVIWTINTNCQNGRSVSEPVVGWVTRRLQPTNKQRSCSPSTLAHQNNGNLSRRDSSLGYTSTLHTCSYHNISRVTRTNLVKDGYGIH